MIGAGQADPDVYRLAEELGAELARRKIIVACGGMGGVMEAVCKGVRSQGGLTIGILPGNSRRDANPWVEIALPTGLGISRNILVVKAGEAVIALDGECGTLSEMAVALAEHIPVISLNNWKLPKDMHRDIIFASDPCASVFASMRNL